MRKYAAALLLMLSGCGYHSRDNQLTGQIKKVVHNTPILCPDFNDIDVSLGVMIGGGQGSVSMQDMWLVVPKDKALFEKLQAYSSAGTIVTVTYDVKRMTICTEEHIATTIEAAKR